MVQLKNPCLNCGDRNINCHSYCLKYKEFEKEVERIREVKAKEREVMEARSMGVRYRDERYFRKSYSDL